jgi:hypothetical protein
VAAGRAEEPFSVRSGLHELKIAILDAIRAAQSAGAVSLDSSHFDHEGITFFVNGKAMVIDGG